MNQNSKQIARKNTYLEKENERLREELKNIVCKVKVYAYAFNELAAEVHE